MPSGELGYDDGTAETWGSFGSAGGEVAVRFTPDTYPSTLLGIKVLFSNLGGGEENNIEYSVWINLAGGHAPPVGSVLANKPYTVQNRGAFEEIDISADSIVINSGDFFCSIVQPGATGMAIGIDVNEPYSLRTWLRFGADPNWYFLPDFGDLTDTMIRAIVQEGSGANARIVELPPVAMPKHNFGIAETKQYRELLKLSDGNSSKTELFKNPLWGALPATNSLAKNPLTPGKVNSSNAGTGNTISGLQGYNLYRSEDSTNFSIIATLDSLTSFFTDNNLINGASYWYYITAVYDGSESQPSATVKAIPTDSEPLLFSRGFMVDGTSRSYLLYIPAAYTGQEDWPLVINYHGYSINAEIQMDYTNMNATADTAHFLVAYPNGLIVDDIVFGGSAPGWYIPGSYGANHDDVAFTSSLIDHINADFNIDSERVHATGWSNGGEFSYYLACMLPDRIASVASVSNAMFETSFASCQVTRPMSTLLFHGTADPIFPYGGIPNAFPPPPVTVSFWGSHNNCSTDSIVTELPDIVATDSSTVTLIEYQNCDPNAEVVFYRINDGGHPWPGSVPRPGWEWLGHTNQDISANSEIWNFFKRNPMPDSLVGIADNADHLSETFRLYQNYPNPFNPSTTIRYSVSAASRVELKIYNALGQLVTKLVDEYQTAGEYSAVWDGKDSNGNLLASGIYFYRIQMGEFSAVRKMAYLK